MTPVESEFSRRGSQLTESGQSVEEFGAPEISPEEFADHMASIVANALSSTKMFEVVEVQSGIGQLHVMGRVRKDKEKPFIPNVVKPILKVMRHSSNCNGFVGKQYLLKDDDDEVRYAWVVSLASNDLRQAVSDICRSFETVVPRLEVTEAPLLGPGTPQSGGRGTGKRGASPLAG
jgi:hypothetical protein